MDLIKPCNGGCATVFLEPGRQYFRLRSIRVADVAGKQVVFADIGCDGTVLGRRGLIQLVRGAQWLITLRVPGAGEIAGEWLVQWGEGGTVEAELVSKRIRVMEKFTDPAGLIRHLWGPAALLK